MSVPQHLTNKPQVVRTQPVILQWDLLVNAVPGSRFRLNLFKDVEFLAYVVRTEKRTETAFSLFGLLQGVPDGYFVLSVEEDAVAGWIDAAAWNLQYWLGCLGEGAHFVQQIDNSRMPGCDGAALNENRDRTAEHLTEIMPAEPLETRHSPLNYGDYRFDEPPGGDFEPLACAQPRANFDILVLYTTQARDAAGGTNAIRAQIQNAMDVTNQAYIDSQINVRVRLAQREAITYPEDNIFGYSGYLSDVRNSSYAQQRRNETGADVVSMWVSSPDRLLQPGKCG